MTITLKTLPEATEQEVFDQVVTHLLTQGKRSMSLRWSGCAYRGQNHLKCAAGCLISDEEYSSDMEGYSWVNLLDRKQVPQSHYALITRLQHIHDGIQPENWKRELDVLATEFKLRMPT